MGVLVLAIGVLVGVAYLVSRGRDRAIERERHLKWVGRYLERRARGF